jgi:hypothetical protein
MEREEEAIIICHQKTMSWVTKEINVCLEHLKVMQRYDKARYEGYLSALKKVQAKLDEWKR